MNRYATVGLPLLAGAMLGAAAIQTLHAQTQKTTCLHNRRNYRQRCRSCSGDWTDHPVEGLFADASAKKCPQENGG